MKGTVRKSKKSQAAQINEVWGSLNWLSSEELTGTDKITLGRVVIKKGCHNPRHTHPNCAEILHLLRGRLDHEVDGERVILEPGDTLIVPTGVPHHAFSIGEEDAEMIVVYDAGKRGFEKA